MAGHVKIERHGAIQVIRLDRPEKKNALTRAMYAAGAKRVYYLSLEFLLGRMLRDALSNLDMTGGAR